MKVHARGKKIFVDLRMAGRGGIGTYLENLVPRIFARLPEFERAYLCGTGAPAWVRENAEAMQIPIVSIDAPVLGAAEQIELPWRVGFVRNAIFWAPHYNAPLSVAQRLVATVHDVCPLAMSRRFPGRLRRAALRLLLEVTLRRAAQVFYPSAFTQSEVRRITGFDPARASIVHEGVDSFWSPADELVRNPFSILCVGSIKPHKNLGTLLEAFRAAKQRQPALTLTVVGAHEGLRNTDSAFLEIARREPGVVIEGTVSNARLRELYRTTGVFVFPSLYEGFGLPLLEAMACGARVVCSRIPVFREIAGGHAIFFDPHDAADLATVLVTTLSAQSTSEATAAAVAHARSFSWDAAADRYAEIFQTLTAP